MNLTTLLADPEAIHLDYIRPALNFITLIVRGSTSDGAPEAQQVSDGWHLLRNLRETLERMLLRAAKQIPQQAAPVIVTTDAVKSQYQEQSHHRLSPHLHKARLRDRTYRPRPGTYLPSARQASWLLLKSEELKEQEREDIEQLCRSSPQIKRARELAHGFAEMVRGRRVEKLQGWLTGAFESKLPELASFSNIKSAGEPEIPPGLSYKSQN